MANPGLLTNALWITPAVMQVAVTAVMIGRRLWRDMPIFLFYTVSHVFRFAILYAVNHFASYPTYFFSYWVAEAFDAIVVFVVVRELYANIFGRYERLDKVSGVLFAWASALLIGVGVIAAAASTGGDSSRMVQGVLAFEQANSILAGGLLLLLFALSSLLNLRWQDALLGVAIGCAMVATGDLLAAASHTQLAAHFPDLFSEIRVISYNCATFIWVVYCLRRKSGAVVPGMVSHSDLERWNRELAQFI